MAELGWQGETVLPSPGVTELPGGGLRCPIAGLPGVQLRAEGTKGWLGSESLLGAGQVVCSGRGAVTCRSTLGSDCSSSSLKESPSQPVSWVSEPDARDPCQWSNPMERTCALEFVSWSCHFLAVLSWVGYLTSLYPSFLICTMGVTIV